MGLPNTILINRCFAFGRSSALLFRMFLNKHARACSFYDHTTLRSFRMT